MNILLVEDDKTLAKAMGIRLKANGHYCAGASDAISAVTEARKASPDLVIVDVNLPGGDGFLVIERLMSINGTADIPFIFITASKATGLRQKALKYGATGFLEKPFQSNELLQLIDSVDTSNDSNETYIL